MPIQELENAFSMQLRLKKNERRILDLKCQIKKKTKTGLKYWIPGFKKAKIFLSKFCKIGIRIR